MGGAIALLVAPRLKEEDAAETTSNDPTAATAAVKKEPLVCLLAPMLKLNVSSLERTALQCVSFVAPTLQLIPSSATDASKQYRDETKRHECETDALTVSGAKLRVASALTCVDTCLKVEEIFESVTNPYLLLIADEDVVVKNEGCENLYRASPSTDKTKKNYAALHGLLCEPSPLFDQIKQDILTCLRAIYDLPPGRPRFEAYVDYMTKGNEILPLGAFSPMAKEQHLPQYLDQLLEIRAEDVAMEAAEEMCQSLLAQKTEEISIHDDDNNRGHYRLALVVVDAPPGKNTWTHHIATDAEWRLLNKYDNVPINDDDNNANFDRWVTAPLWTSIEPSIDYVQEVVRESLCRAVHQSISGVPVTLQDYLQQEGRSASFANAKILLDTDDIQYSRQVLEPILHCEDYPTIVAALYGDAIAKEMGYPALGLSHHAGFQVGLYEAQSEEVV
ncbi:MAG: hypothetical protein SGILL_008964 [Bacillariaceae sp.]